MRNIFVRVRYFLSVMFVILRYQIIMIQSPGRCLVPGSSDHCGSFGWVCSKKRCCHLVWLNVPAERWYRLLPVQSGEPGRGGHNFESDLRFLNFGSLLWLCVSEWEYCKYFLYLVQNIKLSNSSIFNIKIVIENGILVNVQNYFVYFCIKKNNTFSKISVAKCK